MEFFPPVLLDNTYLLIRKVGQGSYGSVWLALDTFYRWVAVKIVHRQPGCERLFDREFSGLDLYDRMVHHEGLVRVFKPARNEAEGFFYYAMEVADDACTGHAPVQPTRGNVDAALSIAAAYEPLTLGSLLRRRGRLPTKQVFLWAESLATALQHLHQQRAIHRDIKPSNILVVRGLPRLADIGLLVESDDVTRTIAGTPGYVPIQGGGECSGDIYALGLVIYEMSTGRKLHEFPDEAADLGQLPPEEADALNELQSVYDYAASKVASKRPTNAAELAAQISLASRGELRRFRLGLLTAAATKVRQEKVDRLVRWSILAGSGTLVLAVTIGLMVWHRFELAARAQVAELGELRFSRLSGRVNGWSRIERARIQEARGKIGDTQLEAYELLAMAGIDAHEVGRWNARPASHVSFHPSEPIALVAGYGASPGRIVRPEQGEELLPVSEPAFGFWTEFGVPRFLVVRKGAPFVVDARTGAECSPLEPLTPEEIVRSIRRPIWTVDRGGRYAAVAIENRVGSGIVAWDLSSGRIVGRHECPASALALTPDGACMAVGMVDGTVDILSLPEMKRLQTLSNVAGRSRVQALAFSPDLTVPLGATAIGSEWCLAVGDHGAGVVVWRLRSGTVQSICRGALWEVCSLAFLPDRITLVSGGRLGLRFWDSSTGELLLTSNEPGDDTVGLGVSHDGKWILAGSIPDVPAARTLLWRMEYGRGVHSLRGLRSAPRLIRFSSDSRWVAALDDNWRLGVWDTRNTRLNAIVEGPAAAYADTSAICFDPQGSLMAFVCNGTATLINATNAVSLDSWAVPKGDVDGIACIDSENFVHAVCRRVPEENGRRRWGLYHLRVGEPARPIAVQAGAASECMQIVLGPSLKLLAVECIGSSKATHLRLVDAVTGRDLWSRPVVSPFDWETPRVDSKGEWLLMSEGTPEVLLTRLADGRMFRQQPRAISVSSDTRWVTKTGELRRLRPTMVEGIQTSLLLLDVERPEFPIPLGADSTVVSHSTQFSPDGASIVWGDERGVLSMARIDGLSRDLEALGTRPIFKPVNGSRP